MTITNKKNTGSFYTCDSIADYIVRWAITAPETTILEPSFGDGIFIDYALDRYNDLGNSHPQIYGVEIQEAPFKSFMKTHKNVHGFNVDFMDYNENKDINAIIGNPPYVGLRNLGEKERTKTLKLIKSYGLNMKTSGSLWMPFIIHSTELLNTEGKLGFVLPYEITYVRYAYDLWNYLASNYGKITICRIYNDFFPNVDVETLIFLAENKGGRTNNVCYNIFETITDLLEGRPKIETSVSISDITSGKKPFVRKLLSDEVNDLLDDLRIKSKLTGLVQDCKFKIGYVCGNKSFFHISEDKIVNLGIKRKNVKKCLTNAKEISSNSNAGIETSKITHASFLFYPTVLNDGEIKYIKEGERLGINRGYKCSVRNPWYLTPGIEVPDLILTVFGDTPRMLLNDGSYYISNSLLGGFSKIENPKELLCRWYNSLTLLSVETLVHSLGGGTLVLIPGETDKLEILSDFPPNKIDDIYEKMSNFAKKNAIEDLYQFGDTIVLKEIYGFSEKTINAIRKSLETLRNWRNPENRRG